CLELHFTLLWFTHVKSAVGIVKKKEIHSQGLETKPLPRFKIPTSLSGFGDQTPPISKIPTSLSGFGDQTPPISKIPTSN
ncbi:hypothetical protein, partial [Dapis sp. BLCC M172]|uniref:hypothetical protein n=1 Tax=Dapis sp. BLCC M172 TaxID=2975281 RepID=UPI003CF8A006